jgi:hypothetical protein
LAAKLYGIYMPAAIGTSGIYTRKRPSLPPNPIVVQPWSHGHARHGDRRRPANRPRPGMEPVMLDVVYLIGGCIFFVIAVLYTTACDHL